MKGLLPLISCSGAYCFGLSWVPISTILYFVCGRQASNFANTLVYGTTGRSPALRVRRWCGSDHSFAPLSLPPKISGYHVSNLARSMCLLPSSSRNQPSFVIFFLMTPVTTAIHICSAKFSRKPWVWTFFVSSSTLNTVTTSAIHI